MDSTYTCAHAHTCMYARTHVWVSITQQWAHTHTHTHTHTPTRTHTKWHPARTCISGSRSLPWRDEQLLSPLGVCSTSPNSNEPRVHSVSTEGERGQGVRGPIGWLPGNPRMTVSTLNDGGVPLQATCARQCTRDHRCGACTPPASRRARSCGSCLLAAGARVLGKGKLLKLLTQACVIQWLFTRRPLLLLHACYLHYQATVCLPEGLTATCVLTLCACCTETASTPPPHRSPDRPHK